MARSELFVPYDTDPYAYDDVDGIYPAQISTQTADFLDLFFGRVGNPEVIRSFFSGDPITLIYRAEIGFYYRLNHFDMTRISKNTVKRVLDNQPPFVLDGQASSDASVFDYLLIALSLTPELTSNRNLPNGASRRGIFSPPETVDDFFDTTSSMKRELTNIANGTTMPSTPIESRSSLWHTVATFQAAKRIPDKITSSGEIEEQAHEQFNALLGDTLVDL